MMQRTNSVTADYTGTAGATILDVDIAVRYECIHYCLCKTLQQQALYM
jgi:hypothetical protein